MPSYADVRGESKSVTDLYTTGSHALLNNWVLWKTLHTLDEEGQHLSQHKFGFDGVIQNWEFIKLFFPSAIQGMLQHDAPFTWSTLVTMGMNSDQHHWLDAVTNETFNGQSDEDEDNGLSTSDNDGDEALTSFSSFEFLEGLQPQSWRNGKHHGVCDQLLVSYFFSFA